MSKAEILIIDDEPQIRKLLEINLESNGYKVLQAATAKSRSNYGCEIIHPN
jgi:two-component system KDP operon response regulator KdpE